MPRLTLGASFRFGSSSSSSGSGSQDSDVDRDRHDSRAPEPPSPLASPSRRRLHLTANSSAHSRSKSQQIPPEAPIPPLFARTLSERRSEGDLSAAATTAAALAATAPISPDVEARLNAKKRQLPTIIMAPPKEHHEMTTGHCMCCDSTVRWPSHLKQFRCTACMTVNDLVKSTKPTPAESPPEQLKELSVDRLREILDAALNDFLNDFAAGPAAANLPEVAHSVSLGPIRNHRPSNRDSTDDPTVPPSRPPPPPPPLPPTTTTNEIEHMEKFLPQLSLPKQGPSQAPDNKYSGTASKLFQPLERYIRAGFSNLDCLSVSFNIKYDNDGIADLLRDRSHRHTPRKSVDEINIPVTEMPGEKEALMLLVGRAVRRDRANSRVEAGREKSRERRPSFRAVPGIDWDALREFYDLLLNPTKAELMAMGKLKRKQANDPSALDQDIARHDIMQIEIALREARFSMIRTLLKTTETLLKRPGRPLKVPEDMRFLLIILANPLLSPSGLRISSRSRSATEGSGARLIPVAPPGTHARKLSSSSSNTITSGPANHSGIVKRLFGLLANLPSACHHYMVAWFSVMPEKHFKNLVEVCGSFVTHRISRHEDKIASKGGIRADLPYGHDWQVKAAAKFMSLLDKANNNALGRRKYERSQLSDSDALRAKRAQIIPSDFFYNTRLDYCDIIADFEAWESRSASFCFCQYPFFLSMAAKTQILEHDARRQMELQARHAFFTNISARTTLSQYMVLRVRRDCLVEDSLKGISESVGTVEDVKKGLKIEFVGEDGIDAGGLKKEWFLMVAREVFDPNHGLFTYDEDASCCYFNPYSFESSQEFYLIGVLFGLAIYNSTILDVSLPSYVFRKLIHFAPHNTNNNTKTGTTEVRHRAPFRRTLEDLAAIRPGLAKGLQQLLDYDGDVREAFCLDFVAETDRYGEHIVQPLCPGGENRLVTNSNRKEYVDLYIKYVLDTSVTRQFEPFKRGFYMVCGGNALSLFGPEEIELLVRGSAEPLDVQALKAVAVYDGWGSKPPPHADPAIRWFWDYFGRISPDDQRKLLSFITGSDRIPATGAASLTIKIACLGQDCERFPVARTCFNQIGLYRYRKRERLERMLWRAVTESEGFGLK